MFLRRAQADDPHTVIIGAFGENHYMKAGVDLADGDETDFAVIEPVIFAFKRRLPFEAGRCLQ